MPSLSRVNTGQRGAPMPQRFAPQAMRAQAMPQNMPQTGLMGYEQAMRQGLAGQQGAQLAGYNQARADLAGAQRTIGNQIGQGLYGAQQAMQGGVNAAGQQMRDTMGQAQGIGQNYLNQAGNVYNQGINQSAATTGQAVGRLDPFASRGASAFDRQAALSGALGRDAQAQAYSDFMESPAQAYLREQSERALTRNASATGGLAGGNVLKELQRNAIGLAAQDYENQFNRLGALSALGAQATGQQANLFGQQAGREAQLRGQQAGDVTAMGRQLSALQGQLGGQVMGYQQQAGQNLGNLTADMRARQAGYTGQIGQAGANLAYGQGQAAGGNIMGALSAIGANRMQVGRDIAGQQQQIGTNLANLINQQGAGVQDVLARNTGTMANILAGSGTQDAATRQREAELLAQLGMGAMGAYRQGALPSLQRKQGALDQLSNLASGLGTAMTGYAAYKNLPAGG